MKIFHYSRQLSYNVWIHNLVKNLPNPWSYIAKGWCILFSDPLVFSGYFYKTSYNNHNKPRNGQTSMAALIPVYLTGHNEAGYHLYTGVVGNTLIAVNINHG